MVSRALSKSMKLRIGTEGHSTVFRTLLKVRREARRAVRDISNQLDQPKKDADTEAGLRREIAYVQKVTKLRLQGVKNARQAQIIQLTSANRLAALHERLAKLMDTRDNRNLSTFQLIKQRLIEIRQEYKKTGKAGQALGRSFSTIGRYVGGFVATVGIAKLTQFTYRSVKLHLEMDKLNRSFEAFVGNAKDAGDVVTFLKERTRQVPVALQEVFGASRAMLATGSGPEDIFSDLPALEKLAVGAQQPLEELATIYGEIRTKDRLYREDVLQFSRRGIPIMQVFQDTLGITREELNKLVSEGSVRFADFQAAIQLLTAEGGRFGDIMDKQLESPLSQLQLLKNEISLAMDEFGEAIVNGTGGVEGWSDAVKFLRASWQGLRTEILKSSETGMEVLAKEAAARNRLNAVQHRKEFGLADTAFKSKFVLEFGRGSNSTVGKIETLITGVEEGLRAIEEDSDRLGRAFTYQERLQQNYLRTINNIWAQEGVSPRSRKAALSETNALYQEQKVLAQKAVDAAKELDQKELAEELKKEQERLVDSIKSMADAFEKKVNPVNSALGDILEVLNAKGVAADRKSLAVAEILSNFVDSKKDEFQSQLLDLKGYSDELQKVLLSGKDKDDKSLQKLLESANAIIGFLGANLQKDELAKKVAQEIARAIRARAG